MYYIKQYGEFYGPFNFDNSLKLCGFLNFLNPGTAIIMDGCGNHIC